MPNERSIYKQDRLQDLPAERTCNRCGETKPRAEMIVQHRREKGSTYYYFRPLCKECNNAKERGHRREYKRNYLRRWRRENAAVDRSYWDNDHAREAAKLRAQRFTQEHREALAIQRRMLTHGVQISIEEARELLAKYGRCYPTRFGLTRKGLLECEKMRNRLRNRGVDRRRRMSAFEIRCLVYEENDGNFGTSSSWVITPECQPVPYKHASRRLKQYHRNLRIIAGEKETARSAAA